MLCERVRQASTTLRLTIQQRLTILEAAKRAFGADVRVRLFGSRVDDTQRGGDFDLYVETSISDPDALVSARLAFLADLDESLVLSGEKIDVVLCSPLHREVRNIDQIARRQGIVL